MDLRYLLDTNALSEPLKPKPSAVFMRTLAANSGRLAISVVTWHEALFGVMRTPAGHRRQRLEDYLFAVVAPSVVMLPYDSVCAECHSAERARLAGAGQPPSFADGQIASTAKVHGLTVVTRNTKDFESFEGILVEDWTR